MKEEIERRKYEWAQRTVLSQKEVRYSGTMG